MADRGLAPAAVVGALVCCVATALFAGLVGGVALAAIGRFTAVSVAALGIFVVIVWRLDRRRHRDLCGEDPDDRSMHVDARSR